MKKIDIECRHINLPEEKKRSLYIYELPQKQTITLCPDCNMVLAGQIMQQLATEVFLDIPILDIPNTIKMEESEKCQKKTKKKKR